MGRLSFLEVGLIVFLLSFGLHPTGWAMEHYTIKPGDTLYGISKSFGVTVEMLKKANHLEGNSLRPKQFLLIPTQREKGKGETVKRLTGEIESYMVKKGDTLSKISKRVGLPVAEIKKINQLHSEALKIGQQLQLQKVKIEPEEQVEEIADAEDMMDEPLESGDGEAQVIPEPLGKWTNPEERSLLVRVVKTFLGAPYRLGGSTLKGLDCSAFVKRIYEIFDIHLPRTSREQFRVGKKVDKFELEEGDLVFFKGRRVNGMHVGIYIGNKQFIHASFREKEVKMDNLEMPYFNSHFLKGVRVKELERDS
jgi:peptidoglycan DL-endopeptidase LytE